MTTCSLFDTVYEDAGGEYAVGKELKLVAKPYVDYLKKIEKWYKSRSVSWEAVSPRGDGAASRDHRAGAIDGARRRPGAAAAAAGGKAPAAAGPAAGSGARRGPGTAGLADRRHGRKGVPVSLEQIDEADLQRIAGEIELSRHVYEHDRNSSQNVRKDDVIGVTRLDKDERLLWLERRPGKPHLKVMRNTYQIRAMIMALEHVMYRPHRSHTPLRNIFCKRRHTTWPDIKDVPVDRWFFLGGDVEGLDEQRRFVRTALGTPDFAFLEGPPGSGKTTALCELVMQMALRGKRVLFCASTHVAVDNLLERLTGAGDEVMRHLVPIRIGVSDKISDEASLYAYDNFVSTMEKNIRSRITAASPRSRAQEMMLGVLGGREGGAIGRMARNHANLVCGTTIGILAHPDIRRQELERFDMMILDEASKTTLQEFLVPAVHADRWVIVGDTRQLVPYVDQDDIAMHVDSCMEGAHKEACLDAFMAKTRGRTTVVACLDQGDERTYARQCGKLGVRLRRPGDGGGPVQRGEVMIGPEREVAKARLAAKAEWRRKDAGAGSEAAAGKRGGPPGEGESTWAHEVAWRMSMHWPGMAGGQDDGAEKIRSEIDMLMPQDDGDYDDDDEYPTVRTRIDRIRRIAVPSALELFQHGFPTGHTVDDTLLEHGMPGADFAKRHVLLEWQHRMHPDIAGFPHRRLYEGRALKTPRGMEAKRDWQYRRYSSRAVWIDVHADKVSAEESPSNKGEAACIAGEIEEFVKFARKNPRPGGGPWEVAVLPFYEGQLKLLQGRMRQAAPRGSQHTFRLPPDRPRVVVRLRTVDSFQGHEADFVLLSTVNSHPTPFLRDPNRLNVALTRARYQCVVVGDKRAMSKDSLLGALADGIDHWTEAK